MTNPVDDLKEIGQLLALGKIILCPTDTIWGLSCDAFNKSAVERIYTIKKRDRTKPLILLVSSISMLKKFARNIHPRVENLIDLYEKPLTVIHEASDKLPDYLITDTGTIAIRLTKDETLQALISNLGKPIVSTSANLQGAPSPDYFDMISEDIKSEVDYVFYTNRSNGKKTSASTIIRYSEEGELFFLR